MTHIAQPGVRADGRDVAQTRRGETRITREMGMNIYVGNLSYDNDKKCTHWHRWNTHPPFPCAPSV